MWLKALALLVLALSGASTAWTAVGRQTANAPITGVRPTWSPNGKQIAFSDIVGSTVNGSWAIFVMNADGTGRRQLVAGSLYAPNEISWFRTARPSRTTPSGTRATRRRCTPSR
jgi:Tol biopolymer transport system component